MLNLKETKSPMTRELNSLIDFSTFTKDETGYYQFIDKCNELFRNKSDAVRTQIFKAGGYCSIFATADTYFSTSESTVKLFTSSFFKLCEMQDEDSRQIVGDNSGYRHTVKSQWNEKYLTFRYPSHFLFAMNLSLQNKGLNIW